jgi:hypothetical protein
LFLFPSIGSSITEFARQLLEADKTFEKPKSDIWMRIFYNASPGDAASTSAATCNLSNRTGSGATRSSPGSGRHTEVATAGTMKSRRSNDDVIEADSNDEMVSQSSHKPPEELEAVSLLACEVYRRAQSIKQVR